MPNPVGMYASNGSWNVSVVNGLTVVPRMAADGSINVVLSDGSQKGIHHACGALRVTVATGTNSTGRHAKDGSMAVSNVTDSFNAKSCTAVSGALV